MANSLNIPKAHLALGLSLPLAVLLGYFLAEPMDLGNLAVVIFVLSALAIPLMIRWYYPALVLLWNAAIFPTFLPGRPAMWALVAFIGLLIAVVSRAVTKNVRFEFEPSIIKPLLVLTGVVVATGLLTGGFGVRMLGSGQYGGKHYFYFLAAVAGYFVFTSRRILPQQAGRYVAMYFLAGLTSGISILASLGGTQGSYLWLLFPPSMSMLEPVLGVAPRAPDAIQRVNELAAVGAALYVFLLARFGVSGVLALTRPWRMLLLALAVGTGMMSGFRSFTLQFAILFAVLFFLEGLHRTRLAAILLVVMLLGGAVVLPMADKLPVVAQRALSFLPGNFDYEAQRDAAVSTEWRIGMWKQMLPELPQFFFRGRGWSLGSARIWFNGGNLESRRPARERYICRKLSQWAALRPGSLRPLRSRCLRLVPGGGPAGAASELEIWQSGAAPREYAAAGGLRRPHHFLRRRLRLFGNRHGGICGLAGLERGTEWRGRSPGGVSRHWRGYRYGVY